MWIGANNPPQAAAMRNYGKELHAKPHTKGEHPHTLQQVRAYRVTYLSGVRQVAGGGSQEGDEHTQWTQWLVLGRCKGQV